MPRLSPDNRPDLIVASYAACPHASDKMESSRAAFSQHAANSILRHGRGASDGKCRLAAHEARNHKAAALSRASRIMYISRKRGGACGKSTNLTGRIASGARSVGGAIKQRARIMEIDPAMGHRARLRRAGMTSINRRMRLAEKPR